MSVLLHHGNLHLHTLSPFLEKSGVFQCLFPLFGRPFLQLNYQNCRKHILTLYSNRRVPHQPNQPSKPYFSRIWANTSSLGITFASPDSRRLSLSTTMAFISSAVWAMGDSLHGASEVMSSTRLSTCCCNHTPNDSRVNAGCNRFNALSSTVMVYVHIVSCRFFQSAKISFFRTLWYCNYVLKYCVFLQPCFKNPKGLKARYMSAQGERSEPWDIKVKVWKI